MGNEHPDLIDLDDGEMFEWVAEPAGGGEAGYANTDDHDFAWPRHVLEEGRRIAVMREVAPAELKRLHQVREDDDPEYHR
ncbi:hypothetical protein BAY61_31960 (plasmid) [Prauserella marina]|nr:hypothetical protein BAY61_31960 [Prauserella marina]